MNTPQGWMETIAVPVSGLAVGILATILIAMVDHRKATRDARKREQERRRRVSDLV